MAEFSSLNGYMVKDTTARNIAKGRNQAVAFSDYATMIETLNTTEKDEYRMGQNFYVGVVGVPDLWVYSVEDIVHNFNYISDEDVVEKLTNNTTIQAGYYKLAMLEGQKVDLTTYDQKMAEHGTQINTNENNIATANSNITTLNTKVGKIKTYVGSDGKLHFVDASGADTALNFNKGVEIKTGTVSSSSYNYQNKIKSVTFNTGVTGYTNGLALVTAYYISSNNAGAVGISGVTSVNASTGVITYSFSDPGGGVYGLNGTQTCKYIFWK